MSLSNNFPTIKPSLNLDFANTGTLDPRITFARASTGTYYDGVSTAKAEQNLVTYSGQMYNGAGWGGAANITTTNAGAASAPDGVDSAALITSTSGTSQHYLQKATVYYSVVAGATYTFSVFLKAGTNSIIQVAAGNATEMGFEAYLNVNLSSGTLGTYGTNVLSPSIVAIGGAGWYRVSFSSVAATTGANGNFLLSFTAENSSAGRIPYIANAGTETFYAWGAQVEQRSSVTAYTATTTQPITNYIPVLQTAAANVARFDHNPTTSEALGLLIEEQRTNLLTYSSDFSNAAWTKANSTTITSNTIVAPDGTLTGNKLVESTLNALQRIQRSVTFSSGAILSISFYVKAAERTTCQIGLFTSSNGNGTASFDLVAKTITVTATSAYSNASGQIIDCGNGWFRIVLSVTTTGITSGTAFFDIGTGAYLGDGYSGIYIWGAQLEAGAFPTSAIATTSAQVTRSADAASMTGTNFSSWFNNAEGTMYAECSIPLVSAGNRGPVRIDDGTDNNRIMMRNDSANERFTVLANGSGQADLTSASISDNTFFKQAAAYQTNSFANVINNGAVATDTTGIVPVVNRLLIGNGANSTSQMGCTIKKLAYYPQRLTNAQLVALTS